MGNLFGKKAKATSRITEQDRAVLQLKQQRDMLRQYQKSIEVLLEKDRCLAKSLVAEGKKERALLLLRKKRYQETLLANTDKQLVNLEQLTSDIEFAQIEIKVVEGLQVGNQALQDLNKAFNIDDIEMMLEETKEAYDKQEEISAMLSGGLTQADEDSVLEELDELVEQDASATRMKSGEVDVEEDVDEFEDTLLPEVPDTKIRPKASREKRLLEAPLES